VGYHTSAEVAVITLDNPPVNGLNQGVRSGLVESFQRALADSEIRVIVLTGAGRGFSAGGDIHELGTPAATASPALSLDVLPLIENSTKPVVAAIHGMAIGGGLETALVCHYRIVATDARIGLPELKRGVIPLSGTQRLPRIMGLTAAIDFILGGELIPAGQLSKFPLFDQIVDSGQVMQAALAFARGPRVAQDLERGTLPLIRHMAIPDPNPAAVMRAAFDRLTPGDFMGREGLRAILAGVEAESFDEGLASARAIFERLVTSDHARQQRDSFFKSRGASVKE
jgi:3-hydroxyacyl-CoA dehydrogenase